MKEFCIKWGKRIATKQMLLIVIVTLAATGIGMWLAQFNGFKILGALIIALLIGMVVQFPIRAWYTKDSAERKAGVKDAAGLIANKFLRLGIILLGFKLNLQLLFTTGAKCLPLAAGVVLVTVLITYGICRLMKVDPLMSILVACGTGICGAAAVMGVSGSIKVSPKREEEKENDEVTAIAIVAIIVAIWWDKKHGEVPADGGKRKVAFPWFMLGFIATAAIGTLMLKAWPATTGFVNALGNDVAKIFLGMAMAALGINVNFKALKKGVKPFGASLIASVILVALCIGLALVFFPAK